MVVLSTKDGAIMPKVQIRLFKRFGKLTVVAAAENKGPHVAWTCACDCGTMKTVRADHLRQGRVVSCGGDNCHSRKKHGMHETRTYTAWQSMIQRVNPNTKNEVHQKHYVQRGITVCEEWRDFEVFFADMGEAPDNLELDRIDNDGNYEPSNCRWATRQMQMINSRCGAPRIHDTDLPRNVKRVSKGFRWEYSVYDDRKKRVRLYGPTVATVEEAVDGLKKETYI